MIYEKMSAESRKKMQKRSKEKFTEIYQKTLIAYGLSPSQAPCSGGFQKCWNDILKVWDGQTTTVKYDVIYMAIYHVAWNRYPVSGLTDAQLELLALVEQVLIDEGYAYEVLSESYIFTRSLDLVEKSASVGEMYSLCHTKWFGKYVYANTYCKILLKNRKISLNSRRFGQIGTGMFHRPWEARNVVNVFEAAIKRLVPNSGSWTRAEWTNENLIMSEIQKAHGVDYTQNYRAFDDLMDVFDLLLNGRSYDRSLLLLGEVPVSMTVCFWPRNTAKSLECFATRVCKRVQKQMSSNPYSNSAFRKDIFSHSWVYRQHTDGTRALSRELKKLMFDTMMC